MAGEHCRYKLKLCSKKIVSDKIYFRPSWKKYENKCIEKIVFYLSAIQTHIFYFEKLINWYWGERIIKYQIINIKLVESANSRKNNFVLHVCILDR